ncbi:MAG: glutamate--tRNA ligase [Actinomycetota bacterium]|nr:glutamate--tRNA ligase [Actinomycetota bacterium]
MSKKKKISDELDIYKSIRKPMPPPTKVIPDKRRKLEEEWLEKQIEQDLRQAIRDKGQAVRVRFAPSPTGYLHIGGARTALYNWLFARKNKGSFILRIEDTDRTRSTEEAIEVIISSLKWLGLDWDEGPYRQTERFSLYHEAVQRLLDEKKAYFCYCTPEELETRREEALKAGIPPRYDRRCRALSSEQRRVLERERKPAIRFACPLEGVTTISDLIRGEVHFENRLLDDFVLLRADGSPTYNFAVVVDDKAMEITHVIRGEDHLPNTPKQVLLYNALNSEPPLFAHLPMIVGPDRKPLSKRHGATSIEEYRNKGYLPEAMVNYLALLGWSLDEKTTLISRNELIEKFSLERVSKAPAVFDIGKLEWMNGYYIRHAPVKRLAAEIIPFLERAGYLAEAPDKRKMSWLERLVFLEQERMKNLAEVVELADFFFKDVEWDPKSVEKILSAPEVPKVLSMATERLESLDRFDSRGIERTLRSLQNELGLHAREVFQPIRVAVTGRMVSPPLFETLELLGKRRAIDRLRRAQKILPRSSV